MPLLVRSSSVVAVSNPSGRHSIEWSMAQFWGWLSANREWVFSGIGVVVLSGIIALARLHASRPSSNTRILQKQKSGSNSTNIQLAGDVTITSQPTDSSRKSENAEKTRSD